MKDVTDEAIMQAAFDYVIDEMSKDGFKARGTNLGEKIYFWGLEVFTGGFFKGMLVSAKESRS